MQHFIERIDEELASKIRSDAEYYQRVEQTKAAVFLYRSLLQRYPNSKDCAGGSHDSGKDARQCSG